jgi:hypothetical protein
MAAASASERPAAAWPRDEGRLVVELCDGGEVTASGEVVDERRLPGSVEEVGDGAAGRGRRARRGWARTRRCSRSHQVAEAIDEATGADVGVNLPAGGNGWWMRSPERSQ